MKWRLSGIALISFHLIKYNMKIIKDMYKTFIIRDMIENPLMRNKNKIHVIIHLL